MVVFDSGLCLHVIHTPEWADLTLRDRREVRPPVHVARAPTEEWVNRRNAHNTMPTDPEASVPAWNDAILRHELRTRALLSRGKGSNGSIHQHERAVRRHPPEASRRRNDPRTTPRNLAVGGAMRC